MKQKAVTLRARPLRMQEAPPEVKQALGHYVFEFSRLEFVLQLVTWSLIDDDLKVGWSITGGDTFGQMLEHCARLVRLRNPDDAKRAQFEAVHNRLKAASAQRNAVLHAFWGWDEGAEVLHTFRVTRAGVPEAHIGETTAADLTRFGDELRTLTKEFGTLGVAYIRARTKG